MEKMTAETGVMNRNAMVSHCWNIQFRVVYLNLIIIETESRVDFMVCYECAKRKKFLLAVVHGSRRHLNSLALSQVRRWSPSLSFAPIFMKDVHRAELNEKPILQFLFFELSLKFIENWQFWVQKMTVMCSTLRICLTFFLCFRFLSLIALNEDMRLLKNGLLRKY